MSRRLITTLAAASLFAAAGTAQAANVEVTVFETLSGVSQQVASWTQDQNATPVAYLNGYYTTVPVFDATGLGGDTTITWYSASHDQLGGFTNFDEDFNVLADTSYAQSESAPTFLPGIYHGVDVKPDLSYIVASYTISVLPAPQLRAKFARFDSDGPALAAVPEPTSWAMLFAGLGMIGLVVRRRRKVGMTDL